MDTFEIIVIIFLFIIIYQIYFIKSVVFTREKFQAQRDEYNTTDDKMTIKKLAQVATEFVNNSKMSGSGILDVKSILTANNITTDEIQCDMIKAKSRDILKELESIRASIRQIKLYS
jgi:hypothetical protein